MTEEKQEKQEIVKAPILANGRGLQLRTIEEMFRFGRAVIQSNLAPKGFTTAEQVLIAVQCGAELGMPPMRSLQSFCIINGQARLYGDAPLALVKQSGLLDWIKEKIEGEGDERVAICETMRKDDPEPVVRTFSVEDAKQANLWMKTGKQGQPTPWVTYPERMLQFRARSLNLRDAFPDCFSGATIAEEYMDIELPEPSHESTVPKREERKVVESQDVPGDKDNQLLEEALMGVYKIYAKRFGIKEFEDALPSFVDYCVKVCGGERDDYIVFDEEMNKTLKPEIFTIEMISQIKEAIDNERPETKKKAVRSKKEEADNGGQKPSAEVGDLPFSGNDSGAKRDKGTGDSA